MRICCGVRPSIFLASNPTATTRSVLLFTATTEGSLMTIPRPFIYTNILAVPRSIPISLRNRDSLVLCIILAKILFIITYS